MNSVLIITNKTRIVADLQKILINDYVLYNVNNIEEAVRLLKKHDEIKIVFLEAKIGEKEYFQFFEILGEEEKQKLTLLGISKEEDNEDVLNIMLDNGVEEFICYPFKPVFLRNRIKRILIAKECKSYSDFKNSQEKSLLHSSELEKERNQYLKKIEEIKKQMEIVLEKSKRESLTNLYNRRTFEEKVTELIQAGKEGCIMMIDIDDFKLINDSRGHVLGDKLLIELANYFKDFIKDRGFVGRLGGDEFAFFMEGIKNEEGQLALQEELSREAFKIGEKFNLEPSLTISIGVTCLTKNVKSFMDIYEVVDQMMYSNKTIRK